MIILSLNAITNARRPFTAIFRGVMCFIVCENGKEGEKTEDGGKMTGRKDEIDD